MASPNAEKKPGTSIDFATIAGLLLAFGAILAGLLMEGGKVQDVSQITAGIIVLGGTIGAVMVTTPLNVLVRAAGRSVQLVISKSVPLEATVEEIVGYATHARKQGIVSLEPQAAMIQDPFLKKALNLGIDGIDMKQIRSIMELEISVMEQDLDAEAKVFEAAGGYSPTVGIIGAVLGLIQVMKNLANIDEVGRGIAVSFVATVYGVALANLFFLPAAAKLKARMQVQVRSRELILDGVLSIVEGMNPKLIRTKLEAYLPVGKSPKKAVEGQSRSPVPAEA